jgi:phosphoglucosamine mutase
VGVVISASHNPFEDNGIKFFTAAGTKLPDAVELEIESRLDEPMGCEASAKLGKARRIDDARGRYVEFCKSTFPNELDLRSMKIALDCAHGAAYMVAPKVFHELGAELFVVGAEPNGMNINDKVGATSPQCIRDAVLKSGADVGIALDGDGDRIVMVDADGDVYDGDKILYVIAKAAQLSGTPRAGRGRHPDEQSRLRACPGTPRHPLCAGQGGRPLCAGSAARKGLDAGRRKLRPHHLPDHHTTGDGIIAGLQVLAALQSHGLTLKEMCADLVFYPQKLINVRMAAGFDWKSDESIAQAVKAAEAALDGSGRVLLRPSGTEPLLRVMVEGRDGVLVNAQAEAIAGAVRNAVGA